MYNRRDFLRQSMLATGALLGPAPVFASDTETKRLVILHTNDVHSRLDPFPMDGSRNQGLGGVAARAALIQSIRSREEQVLLLDAGDIFQGTPYFNVFKGEPEIKAMSMMGYDACTMGNHDFDAGLENFATQLQHARFPVVICNYDFTGTPMENRYKPHMIIRKGGLKIGITGVGIELKGLVPDDLAGKTQYLDPIACVNRTAEMLKKRYQCDMVICLSHLGYQYRESSTKVSDISLAKETAFVDLIIGGHTHTFLDKPVVQQNKNGADVVINQVGWGGILLGRLDYEFTKDGKKNLVQNKALRIEQKSVE